MLWGPGGNVTHNVVETAVIQLYCSGSGFTNLVFTWTKDDRALTNNPPHLRIRTSSTGTTFSSVLTIDNFGTSDDGEYMCKGTGSIGSVSSGRLTLTGEFQLPLHLYLRLEV